jgi:hypothetical protein
VCEREREREREKERERKKERKKESLCVCERWRGRERQVGAYSCADAVLEARIALDNVPARRREVLFLRLPGKKGGMRFNSKNPLVSNPIGHGAHAHPSVKTLAGFRSGGQGVEKLGFFGVLMWKDLKRTEAQLQATGRGHRPP